MSLVQTSVASDVNADGALNTSDYTIIRLALLGFRSL
jgi:hypothetical protein